MRDSRQPVDILGAVQISKMSTVERLQAMEELWDSLCHGGSEMPSPVWHGVLSDRKARAASGEARFLTLDQLKERLRDTTR